jgi:hypothetical protein
MRREVREAVPPAEAVAPEAGVLRCESRGKSTAASRVRGHARRDVVASVRTLFAHVRLRSVGLHKLLPGQSALLTCILYLFPSLRSLCRRKASQLAVFTTLQGAFSTQLLLCIELLLPLRLHVCLGLRIWKTPQLAVLTTLQGAFGT